MGRLAVGVGDKLRKRGARAGTTGRVAGAGAGHGDRSGGGLSTPDDLAYAPALENDTKAFDESMRKCNAYLNDMESSRDCMRRCDK